MRTYRAAFSATLAALLAAALAPPAFAAGGGEASEKPDGFERLRSDPSPRASDRLSSLLRSARDSDQRFWIIHALGARLKEHSDPAALDALLDAAQDKDPKIRGPVLRALSGFTVLAKQDIGEGRLSRISAAAAAGRGDGDPAVRYGADDLTRTLELWKTPGLRTTPAPPPDEPEGGGYRGAALRTLRWLWVLLLPVIVLAWFLLGLPVLERESEEGRLAQAAWETLRRQRVFLAASGFLWLCLAGMLAGYGFDLLVLVLGSPLGDGSGAWGRFYFSAGVCLYLPGALAAAALAKNPSASAAASSLRFAPWAMALGAAVILLLWPMEIAYRLFLRRPRPSRAETAAADAFDTVLWALETGALRSAFMASAVSACEGHGLLPALRRARELFGEEPAPPRLGLGIFDARFALMCVAPMLAVLCALIARGQPVEWRVGAPIILLGCSLWSWLVLAGVLWAVALAFEGVGAAGTYRRLRGLDAPGGTGEGGHG